MLGLELKSWNRKKKHLDRLRALVLDPLDGTTIHHSCRPNDHTPHQQPFKCIAIECARAIAVDIRNNEGVLNSMGQGDIEVK